MTQIVVSIRYVLMTWYKYELSEQNSFDSTSIVLLFLNISVFAEKYLVSPSSTQSGTSRKWELVAWIRNSMPSSGEHLHHVFFPLKLLNS